MKIIDIHKIVKRMLQFGICICATVFAKPLTGQIYVEESGMDLTEVDLSEYEREEIVKSVNNLLNRYNELGNFIGEDRTFSEEKFAEFLSLFTGVAKVYNDLVEEDNDNIEYSVYADIVYQYLQGVGVKFELSEIYLNKIAYDEGGFYIATVNMEKLMLNGLNENNIPVSYNNGKAVSLEMQIEIPDYDFEQAAIIGILGESQKIKVDAANLVSVAGFYDYGMVSSQTNTEANGFSNGEFPISLTVYGVESLFKKTINRKKTLSILLGAKFGFHNYDIDLTAFDGQGKGEDLVYSSGKNSNTDEITTIVEEQTRTYLSGPKFGEKLQVMAIEVPIGLSYLYKSGYYYDFFVDAGVAPFYSLSGSGNFYHESPLTYLDIAESLDKQKIIEDKNEAYYKTEESFQEKTTIRSHFSAAAFFSAGIHYKFNYRMALEFGVHAQYSFLSTFKHGHNDGTTEQLFLDYLSRNETEYTSTIQHYMQTVNPLRVGAKLGIVFKL